MLEVLLQTLVALGIYLGFVVLYTIAGYYQNLNIFAMKWDWKTWLNGLAKWGLLGVVVLGVAVLGHLLIAKLEWLGITIDNVGAVSPVTIFSLCAMGSVSMAAKIIKKLSVVFGISDEMLEKIQQQAVDNEHITLTAEELPAPAIVVEAEKTIRDIPVLADEVTASLGDMGSNNPLTDLTRLVGEFINPQAGRYRGQCPEVVKRLRMTLGAPYEATGNGKDVVNNLIARGKATACGREAGAVFSMIFGTYGHTGVVIDDNYLIEQNVSYAGSPTQDFGEGKTYPVRIGRFDEEWRSGKTIVYARLNDYPQEVPVEPPHHKKKSDEEIADEVIAGKWGNGQDRKDRLAAAGYDPSIIQNIVNTKISTNKPTNKTYTVKKGDSLWKIAVIVYNNGNRWTEIYNANRKIISNPNKISAGQVLIIP